MPPTPLATILPDPSCLKLLELKADTSSITATVTTTAPTASCPVCQRSSTHAHSRDARHLADLPWQGVAVRLVLHVRKFFCFSCLLVPLALPFFHLHHRIDGVLVQAASEALAGPR